MTPQQKQMQIIMGADTSTEGSNTTTASTSNDNTHNKNNNQPTQNQVTIARKVDPSQLAECGERLRAGDLVAFPTETVYGLGCHALDPAAVQKVFAAKERPLTDPLIVHVARTQDAMPLWLHHSNRQDDNDNSNDADTETATTTTTILKLLCDTFWPGPLTLVSKAAPHVPPILMANTGFVACRCPKHSLAQDLIREAKVPIAAPSANKFGHVSPTRADHVMDDLGQENVWVLEGQQQQHSNNASGDDNHTQEEETNVICQVGVESTVAKLEKATATCANDNDTQQQSTNQYQYALTVLRQGAIAVQDLQECLDKAGLQHHVHVSSLSSRAVEETEATVAPGQTIKHYSPRIPSFLLAPNLFDLKSTARSHDNEQTNKLLLQQQLARQSIVLDFGGKLASWKAIANKYRDLSPSGDSSQAAQCVFEALRWAERIDQGDSSEPARTIVFPQVVSTTWAQKSDDALTLALHDRLSRAASGVVLESEASLQQVLNDHDDHNRRPQQL